MTKLESIEQLGNRLLEKAGIADITTFTQDMPEHIATAHAFDAEKRVIYCSHDYAEREYADAFRRYREQGGAETIGYLDALKINIAHEVGHAQQKELIEAAEELYAMRSEEAMNRISSVSAYQEHLDRYHGLLLSLEEDAWERAWALIGKETDRGVFDFFRENALGTYDKDLIVGQVAEFQLAELRLAGNGENQVGRITSVEQLGFSLHTVAFLWEGRLHSGEVVEQENAWRWGDEIAFRYDRGEGWVEGRIPRDSEIAEFVIDCLNKRVETEKEPIRKTG